ncbi:hypothetical protein BDDG_12513 [Blastomyces dermatitidis ATCC 18188]|uniref:Uncharacterized protein n=1 Tax=Ajellomyces dermatitidis (strain ATCC 18188 / CBS 674.68) TaxID=653446 RepID=A0A0J9EPS0_AJEDA|nr:hypothetical protein BDDG_12513 [Blastomyces dermatitidis ATCC 18188]
MGYHGYHIGTLGGLVIVGYHGYHGVSSLSWVIIWAFNSPGIMVIGIMVIGISIILASILAVSLQSVISSRSGGLS